MNPAKPESDQTTLEVDYRDPPPITGDLLD